MKNRHGFTLIEVLMAIFILVSSVYVLTDLQIRSLFRVLKDRGEIDRVYLIKKESYTHYLTPPKEEKPITKKIDDPVTNIKTEIVEINKKSVFHEFKDSINLVKTTGSWKEKMATQEITMMTIVEKSQKEEKKS
jgi:prepilin-type N-terminal cleavage/methylation domain-containing protein